MLIIWSSSKRFLKMHIACIKVDVTKHSTKNKCPWTLGGKLFLGVKLLVLGGETFLAKPYFGRERNLIFLTKLFCFFWRKTFFSGAKLFFLECNFLFYGNTLFCEGAKLFFLSKLFCFLKPYLYLDMCL